MNKLTLIALAATASAVQISAPDGSGNEMDELGGLGAAPLSPAAAPAELVKVAPVAPVAAKVGQSPLTAGAPPDGTRPRWGDQYPTPPVQVVLPENWAIPSTNGKNAGPLTEQNGDSQSFLAGEQVRFGQVTPAGNVPANPDLTAGAAAGNQPRWGSRYPVIPAAKVIPENKAMPSTNGKLAGPLTATNGDSQSFIAQSLLDVTPATNVPANPALTAGAAPGNQPRWGSRYPVIPAAKVIPENKAMPSTNGKLAGPLTATNGDSQSFLAGDYVRFGQVTPATNVPANPALTAGATPGNQPRWGSRYPKIPAPVVLPENKAMPSTNGKVTGPLTATNGDSQSFFAGDYVRFGQVTPATNVPANPALTAGAAPGNQPRWGSRYPKIIAPVAAPINWAVPSTNGKVAGPLTATNGDSQSFFAGDYVRFGQVTPATNVPANPALTAGAAPGNQPRWGSRYPVIPAAVAKPINWAVPSTNGKVAGPLTSTNGDSQSFLTIAPANRVTPDHPVFQPSQTAGAPADGTKPRFGTPYNLKQVTPEHPFYDPSLTAGAPAPAMPRWGSTRSLVQEDPVPEQPKGFDQNNTAGAPVPDAPRFGTPYRGYNAHQVTPDHPVYPEDQTAGAPVPSQPRYGKAYHGGNRKDVESQVAAQY